MGRKSTKVKIRCTECGRIFKRIISKIREKDNFCSRKCYGNSKSTKVLINCGNCKLEIELPENKLLEVNFCSISCSNQARGVYTKQFEHKKCKNCNVKLEYTKDYKQRIYCSRECNTEFRVNKTREEIESGDTTKGTAAYRKYLIHIHGTKCMKCDWAEINPTSGKIPIELEHIDGNSENNNLNNLKLLCPNCHSLTPTYRSLNNGNGRHKRSQRYRDGKSH